MSACRLRHAACPDCLPASSAHLTFGDFHLTPAWPIYLKTHNSGTQLAAELPPLSDLPPSLLLSSQQTTPSPPGQFDRDLESTAQPLISSSSRLRNSAAARLASSTSHCYPRPRLVFRQHLALQLIPPPGVLALCLSCASRHFLLLSRAPVLVLICPPTVSIRWLSLAHFPCAPFRDSHLERLSVTFRYPSAEHHLDNDMT